MEVIGIGLVVQDVELREIQERRARLEISYLPTVNDDDPKLGELRNCSLLIQEGHWYAIGTKVPRLPYNTCGRPSIDTEPHHWFVPEQPISLVAGKPQRDLFEDSLPSSAASCAKVDDVLLTDMDPVRTEVEGLLICQGHTPRRDTWVVNEHGAVASLHGIGKQRFEKDIPVIPLLVDVLPVTYHRLRHIVTKYRGLAKDHTHKTVKRPRERIEEGRAR